MTYELNLQRQIAASPEAVFAAFTDPEAQAEWFREPTDEVVSITVDARVGGTWEMLFRAAGQEYHHVATFTEVDAPSRLVAAMTYLWPADERNSSVITVTCEPADGGTLLTMHEEFENERFRDTLAEGWPRLLDVLKEVAEHGLPAVAARRAQ